MPPKHVRQSDRCADRRCNALVGSQTQDKLTMPKQADDQYSEAETERRRSAFRARLFGQLPRVAVLLELRDGVIRDGVAFVVSQASLRRRTILRAPRKAKARAYRSTSPRVMSINNGNKGSSAPMRFVRGSHASGFRVHIFASVLAAQYPRCRVLD
jgi:hypothetical protein